MRHFACLTSLALSTVLAPCAGQFIAQPQSWTRPFPDQMAGNVVSTTIGDFDGDGGGDLAFVDDGDGRLIFGWYPEVLPHYVDPGIGGVTSIARLPIENATDALIVVGTDGARIVQYDPVAKSFWTLLIPAWADVRVVEAHRFTNLAGTKTFALAGITDTGGTIRVGSWSAGGTFSSLATISDPDVLELEFADWDHATPALPELIVRTQNELRVYDAVSGVLEASEIKASTVANGGITRVLVQGSDRVAWVRFTATNKWRLHVYEAGAQVQAFNLVLHGTLPGSTGVVNIDAGDYDGDGHDDLLLYDNGTQYRYVLAHDDVGGGYSIAEYYLIGDGVPDPLVDTEPALFTDVNNDQNRKNPDAVSRLADVVTVQQSLGQFSFHADLDSAFPGAIHALQPQVQPPAPLLQVEEDYPIILNLNPATGGEPTYLWTQQRGDADTFVMQMTVPEAFEWATHIQVVVWHQEVVPGTVTHIIMEDSFVEPFPGVGQQNFTLDKVILDNPSGHPNGKSWMMEDQYFLQIRMYMVDGNGQIHSSPAYLFGVACDEDEGHLTNGQGVNVAYAYYLEGITTGPGGEAEVSQENHPSVNNRTIGIIKTRRVAPPGLNVNEFPIIQ